MENSNGWTVPHNFYLWLDITLGTLLKITAIKKRYVIAAFELVKRKAGEN